MKKIKLGIDIHGVINEMPEFFASLTKALVDAGHEVHILTGPQHDEKLEAELKSYGISWTHIFSIVSYHQEKGTAIRYDKKGDAFLDDYAWDRAKGDYCIKHQIDLHLDDSDIYSYFFKTPYARIFSKNKRKHYLPKND